MEIGVHKDLDCKENGIKTVFHWPDGQQMQYIVKQRMQLSPEKRKVALP